MNVLNRRWLFRVGVGLVGALLAIQLVPYGRSHSNETEWPAYASIAPASWLVQHDVDEGRAVLNLSEWQRPQKKATKASEELLEGEMPPAAYLLMHAHARLSLSDRDRLARGLAKTLGGTPEQEAHER